MLQLNGHQTQALQAIKLARDLRSLRERLADAFPDVATRAGERFEALIAHGVQRGAALGLTHLACVARYLACWFMLGAEFEARPEYVWAGEILAPSPKPLIDKQGSRIFQLCRRTREELTRLAQKAPLPAAGFDAALKRLDSALLDRGLIGSLLTPERIRLGEPCDIDALELRLLDAPPAQTPQRYRFEQGQWRRSANAVSPPPILLTGGTPVGQDAPKLPPRLHLLSQAAGVGGHGRLRLRSRADHACDAKTHPLVTLNGAQGLREWRGALAADITMDLYAAATEAVPGLQPTIALEPSPQLQLLSAASCGLRESGQPLGEQSTQVAVYPGEQHLMAWRRESGPVLNWPEGNNGQPALTPSRCRVERDGTALDAKPWQAGLDALDQQLLQGLARLATAWERESGVTQGRLQAEPALFCGSAGITWGFAETRPELTAAPLLRLAGALDLVACRLQLHFTGELGLLGTRSRLTLDCSASEPLHTQFERTNPDLDIAASIKPAQIQFRQPFVLQLEALAQADPPALADVAAPVAGALVGECGLRARKDGPGLQWFMQLRVEPVSVLLHLNDPMLAQVRLIHPLLPATKLVDWSLG